MSFIDAWKQWSQNLWDNWGKNLQKQYDDIAALKLPPEIQKLVDDIWTKLDPVIAAKLLNLIAQMYAKYGPDAVISFIKNGLFNLENLIVKPKAPAKKK